MIRWRGCLTLLFCAAVGYALVLAFALGVHVVLHRFLPEEVIVVLTVCVGIPLWPILSFVAWFILVEFPRFSREVEERAAFLRRPPLTDEAFGALFAQAAVAVEVRAELARLLNNPQVTERLLPEDAIRATSRLFGYWPDNLDWADFLFRLGARFGVSIPGDHDADATVAELVAACMAKSKPA